MSDAASDGAAVGTGGVEAPTAGRLLRQARERQGLHIAALAAAIKVPPKKLEALESDRHDLLPDATFVRALAQTVCRALKIDPAEVLRLLPPSPAARLGPVGDGLNTPFRDRASGPSDRSWRATAAHPAVWVTVLILAAAAGVLLWPEPLSSGDRGAARATPGGALVPAASPSARAAGADAASGASSGEVAPVPAPLPAPPALSASASVAPTAASPMATSETPTAAPLAAPTPVASAAPEAAASAPAGALLLRARAESWVGVTDARGAVLVGRALRSGEAIGLDGVPPFRIRIGNAAQTELVLRGQPVELAAHTRDNVARLDLR